ncbi:MAG: hypothetical protein IJ587_00545, partial [Synergistaceae bacterium]|nr:hypothetical protein [Synergistaceae bacterium]
DATQGKALSDTLATKANTSAIPAVVNNLTSDSSSAALSAAQGKALKGLVDSKTSVTVVNNLTTTATGYALDATQGKALSDTLATKANTSAIPPVVNNLTTTTTTSALSAAQGKALNDAINVIKAVTTIAVA